LEPEEKIIINRKYAAPTFGTMDAGTLFGVVEILLLKLHVITGWAIPADELQTILTDQLAKKFQESYQNVNAEEMEYAFRSNTEVKDWGKAMNLNLIDEVMRPYLNKRFELSRIEEQQKAREKAEREQKLLPPPEISDADFIEAVYQSFKITGQSSLIPVLAYQILKPTLSLTPEKKAEIKASIHFEPETPEETKQLMCKQKAVALYFENNYKK
jgi:hypothetical protein